MRTFRWLGLGLVVTAGCFSEDSAPAVTASSGDVTPTSAAAGSDGSASAAADSTGAGTGDSAVDIEDAIFSDRSGDCIDYDAVYMAMVTDLGEQVDYTSMVSITADDAECVVESNAIPNHDFNDMGSFATVTSPVERTFVLPRLPEMAGSSTDLELSSFDAILLNGVVVDLLAAGCYGVGDGMIGCFDPTSPWRSDPMSPLNDFGTDSHHAHTQPDGTYHYHGDPVALYDESGGAPSGVIGFAADGFPIYGPWFDDGVTVRRAVSGYTLMAGARPDGPGGAYDGRYVDDYEFTDAGDLDECNGMTVDGQYGYYLTDTYPWILRCFRGIPDPTFGKM